MIEPVLPASSGIYKITCTVNKKIYIGSAVNLQQRRRQHLHALRHNKHHSRYLQRAWNKYGEEAFIFEVLELVLPIFLTAREQYWLNKLKPFGRKGFNLAIEAESSMGVKATAETIEKLRQSHTGKKQSPEIIEKRIAPLRGRKRPDVSERMKGNKHSAGKKSYERTPEHCERMSQIQHSPEVQEKQKLSHRDQRPSLQTIEAIRQAKLAYWARVKEVKG